MSIGRTCQHGAQHGGSCLVVVEQSRGENKMADAHIKQMVRPSPANHTRSDLDPLRVIAFLCLLQD